MNCTEFQEILPEVFEAGRTAEQATHLKSCPRCSGLLADLDLIAREARQLQELAEPSPRVWNSIEIELRREGVIHELQHELRRGHEFQRGPALLAPVGAPLEPRSMAGPGGGPGVGRIWDRRVSERLARPAIDAAADGRGSCFGFQPADG